MTIHLILVRLFSLTIFLFFFFMRCFVLLPFISLYTSSRLTGEERAKAMSRKEIENCVVEPKTMKISSSLHRIMVCDFLLFIWDYEANSLYILLTLSIFWKHFSGKYHFFSFAFSLSFFAFRCIFSSRNF